VQDNDVAAQGMLRDPLDSASRSYVVPEIVSESGTISQVRLSNLSADAVEATLYFTPRGADGFDPVRVPSARVVVPPGEVVSLSDPLRYLFGLSGRGQLEVRAPGAAIGRLTVSASTVSASSPDRRLAEIPVLQRSEGATAGVTHLVPGVVSDAQTRTDLVLVETSGTGGVRRGETRVRVPRYGMKLVADVAALLGGGSLAASRFEVLAAGGGGSLVALGKVVDRDSGSVPDGVRVWSRLLASPANGAPGGDNPVVPVGSEIVTGFAGGANRALHLDGLSLAIDSAEKARWAVVIAEVGGFTGQLVVDLREPGSIVPIKSITLTVPRRGALTLDSVFKALGLEGKTPKQLTNVRCTLRPLPGSNALFTAVGVQIDPLSGEARIVSFSPAGGVRPSGPSLAGSGELLAPPDVPDRRRPVRR
jgi:hypothetical protein